MARSLAPARDQQERQIGCKPKRHTSLLRRRLAYIQDRLAYRVAEMQRLSCRKIVQRVGKGHRDTRRQRCEQAVRKIGLHILLMHQQRDTIESGGKASRNRHVAATGKGCIGVKVSYYAERLHHTNGNAGNTSDGPPGDKTLQLASLDPRKTETSGRYQLCFQAIVAP